jgi:hypothetical protein
MDTKTNPHPIQPIVTDDQGVKRFRGNAIVRRLLDENGKLNLNDIARWDVSQDDREQFAMLIGYSVSGFSDLSYARDETVAAVDAMEDGMSEADARTAALRSIIAKAQDGMREGVAELFSIHPDDLAGTRT